MKRIHIHRPFGSQTLNYLRAELPLRHLKADLKKDRIDLVHDEIGVIQGTSAYCFANCPEPSCFNGLKEIQATSKLCWTVDDNYFAIPADNPARHKINPLHLAGLKWAIDYSDQLWVTTEPLKKLYKRGTVVPNIVDMDDYENATGDSKKPGVFWAGSATHLNDLDLIADLPTYFKDLKFYFLGQLPERCSDYTLQQQELVCTPLKKNVAFIAGVPQQEYQHSLDQIIPECSLGLCPLQNTVFNICKSTLKVLEFMAYGLTVVASDVVPYNEIIIHGVNGYLTKPDNWFATIEYALSHPLGDNAKQFVAQNWSWQAADKKQIWLDAFRSLVETVPPKIQWGTQ